MRDLWGSRRVARMIGQRDMKVKYKQAALGPLWLLIGPLGMLVAITIAFSGVTKVDTGDVPYVLFALVGLVVWNYLQVSLLVGAQAIAGNNTLVRRSSMPRVALVTGSLLGNLPPLIVTLGATLVLAVILVGLPIQALLIPVLIAWLLLLVGGLAMLMAAITTRFRDVLSVMPLIVQAGLFVTPVGYPIDGAPHNINLLLSLNPASGLIEAWRWAIVDISPDLTIIGIGLAWTVVLVSFGWYVFSRLEVTFADVV
jgi:ABC-2 type transport system permease protein/lipopolysaccharide transport system permease protein